MKHTDFIKSLKRLKSQLQRSENKYQFSPLVTEEKTHHSFCSCVDSNGESKYLYASQKEIEYLLCVKDITLYSYPCPYEKGWHLTKG